MYAYVEYPMEIIAFLVSRTHEKSDGFEER